MAKAEFDVYFAEDHLVLVEVITGDTPSMTLFKVDQEAKIPVLRVLGLDNVRDLVDALEKSQSFMEENP